MDLPYAETVNYWKTGGGSPDGWIEKACREIEGVGGVVQSEGFGRDVQNNTAAYMLAFEVAGERFRVTWPVLPTKSGKDEQAARRQAATMLYHDVKARCVAAKVLGVRASFFSFLLLPSGTTAAEANMQELTMALPLTLGPGSVS